MVKYPDNCHLGKLVYNYQITTMAVWDVNFPNLYRANGDLKWTSGMLIPIYSWHKAIRRAHFSRPCVHLELWSKICTFQNVPFQRAQISWSRRLRLLKMNICKYTLEFSCGPLSLFSRNSFTMRSSWPLFPARASHIFGLFLQLWGIIRLMYTDGSCLLA